MLLPENQVFLVIVSTFYTTFFEKMIYKVVTLV